MIAEGAQSTGDPVWTNTCQWLLAGKVRLYILSPTHDSAERVQRSTGHSNASGRAYFGMDEAVPLGRFTMAESMAAEPAGDDYGKVTIMDTKIEGRPEPGKILIVDPIAARDKTEVRKRLIHEVQHTVAHLPKKMSAEMVYKAEFDALWVSGEASNKSSDPQWRVTFDDGKRIHQFNNPRQLAIFNYLYNSYDFVAPAWNSPFSGKTFQNAVLSHRVPKGINLGNSLRIDNLYDAVNAERPDVTRIEVAFQALSDVDRSAIQDQAQSWRTALKASKLPLDERARLEAKLNLSSQVPSAHTNKLAQQ